jgi:hypothetical protein
MSVEVGQPVAAAATTQFKLCLYNEEELAIWFHLIKAQFAAVGIELQKLKYANALANLPKQVLRDILCTADACNEHGLSLSPQDTPSLNIHNHALGRRTPSLTWQ